MCILVLAQCSYHLTDTFFICKDSDNSGIFVKFAPKITNYNKMKRQLLSVFAAFMLLGNATAQDNVATFRTWAQTPPMGWNSWDCYYSSVTEKEVMQNAQYLVDNDLVRHGWEYVVIDIRWYCNHPSLGAGNYNQRGDQDYVLDEYGRYLPSPTRFPSCMQDGKNIGFKAIADKLHKMGMKFGIHIMPHSKQT